MAVIMLFSSCPALPTKGMPCASSSAPGPSPTNIRRAVGSPSPKTSLLRPLCSAQRVQSPMSSRMICRAAARSAGGTAAAICGRGGKVGLRGGNGWILLGRVEARMSGFASSAAEGGDGWASGVCCGRQLARQLRAWPQRRVHGTAVKLGQAQVAIKADALDQCVAGCGIERVAPMFLLHDQLPARRRARRSRSAPGPAGLIRSILVLIQFEQPASADGAG